MAHVTESFIFLYFWSIVSGLSLCVQSLLGSLRFHVCALELSHNSALRTQWVDRPMSHVTKTTNYYYWLLLSLQPVFLILNSREIWVSTQCFKCEILLLNYSPGSYGPEPWHSLGKVRAILCPITSERQLPFSFQYPLMPLSCPYNCPSTSFLGVFFLSLGLGLLLG